MAGGYGANQYKQTSVGTASRTELLIMLYEAAIRHVKKASEYIDQKNVSAKGVAIGKAHDIINELLNTLNYDVGGDIARNLQSLYNFMIEQLIKANMQNQKAPLEAVQKLLENLLEGWKGAIEQVNKGQGK